LVKLFSTGVLKVCDLWRRRAGKVCELVSLSWGLTAKETRQHTVPHPPDGT
jgi:hypothetical protein